MVDATIIHAPPSTKNEAKQRDPEMRQTKKGNQWYFGMKIHVGADVNSGLAHTVAVTAANEADVSQLPNLLREDDRAVFGDKGYVDKPEAGSPQGRRLLGRGTEVHQQAQADRGEPTLQPQDVLGPQPRGASLPSDKASIWLHQGALQRLGEERCPGLHPDRADQSLSGEASHADLSGKRAPAAPRTGDTGDRNSGYQPENGAFVVAL